MATNPLREIWAENRTAFGLWSVIPGTIGAEILAKAGTDYVCVDQQHAVIDYDSMVPMFQVIQAGGAAPITRVLSNDPFLIMKALDAGAWAVIVPLVGSAGDAARAVSACRYPPRGARRRGPLPRHGRDGGGPRKGGRDRRYARRRRHLHRALGPRALPRAPSHPGGDGRRARRGRKADKGGLPPAP